MKSKERRKTILLFLLAILVITAALYTYMRVVWNIVQENTVETMREITAHDKKCIEGENTYVWEQLRQVYERLKEADLSDTRDVCSRLNMESSASYFDGVYLVDRNGQSYSHTGNIKDGNDTKPVQRILAKESQFAINFRTGASMERYRDYLAYGISFPTFTVADVDYIGLYVMTSISDVEERMKLDSFSGQGLTSVFDADGYYVVRKNQKVNIAKRENYYEQIQEKYGCTTREIETLKEKIAAGDSFVRQFTAADGTKVITCFERLDGINWFMILEVPQSAISKSVRNLVWMMFAMLFLITVIILFLTIFLVKTRQHAMRMQEQAVVRSQFLANMSHEIRTPLNGIIGLNHLMTVNLDKPEKLRDYLAKSSSAEQYLLSLINDILDVQKLQVGKMELVYAPFSVEKMLTSLDVMIRNRMKEKGITYTVEKQLICDSLLGDAMRIQQILINILGNAVKFTGKEGTVSFRIHQTQMKNGQIETRYEIEDNGCGMTPEFCRIIFEPFSQERLAKSVTSAHGTGLGMNISYELSRQMGGQLSVTSRVNEGSCFIFTVSNAPAPREAEKTIPETTHQKPDHPLNILIAEDNALNAEILSELLQNHGHHTQIAVDGREVVDQFAASDEFHFDLILMDVQMPRQNGCQAASEIRALPRADAEKVLIFACTANTFQEDVEMTKQAGMNDFIVKPIDVSKLMEKIKTCQRNGENPDEKHT